MYLENPNKNNPLKESDEFLSFEKTDNFKYMVQLIQDKYKHITDAKIQDALMACLEELEPPRKKDDFIKLFKKNLGI